MYRIKSFAGIVLPELNFMDPYDAAAGQRPTFTDHRLTAYDGIMYTLDGSNVVDVFSGWFEQQPKRLQRRQVTIMGSIYNAERATTGKTFKDLREKIGTVGPLVRELQDGQNSPNDTHTIRAILTNVQGGYEPGNDRFIRDFTMTFDLIDPAWKGPPKDEVIDWTAPFTITNNGDAWLYELTFYWPNYLNFGAGNRTLQFVDQAAPASQLLRTNFTLGWSDPVEVNGGATFNTRDRLLRMYGLADEPPTGSISSSATLTFSSGHNINDLFLIPPALSRSYTAVASGAWVLPLAGSVKYSDAWY